MIGELVDEGCWDRVCLAGLNRSGHSAVEIDLISAKLGRPSGIFPDEVCAIMHTVIALTTLSPPFTIWLYKPPRGAIIGGTWPDRRTPI